MAKEALSLPTLCLVMLLLSLNPGGTVKMANGQKTFCVAKPSTDEVALENNIQFVCSIVDCNLIQKDGPCFNPDTAISHASVAMNLYYQSRGRNAWNCYFNGSGLTALTDPSYGDCKYA